MAFSSTSVLGRSTSAAKTKNSVYIPSAYGSRNDLGLTGRDKTFNAILDVINEELDSLDAEDDDWEAEIPILVGDMGEVHRKRLAFKHLLPRVVPHFAVKSNPDPVVINLLNKHATYFDCASWPEIAKVLSLGVDPSRIIFAHPRKDHKQACKAVKNGINIMTFDGIEELDKAKKYFPSAKVIIRIAPDDSASSCRLSSKFGCGRPYVTGEELIDHAYNLGLDVVGVSFHIGSGCSDPEAFSAALQSTRELFDYAATLGYDLKTVDIGGGFTDEKFEDMAEVINNALEEYFPSPNVRIIAEPGRLFVGTAYHLASKVTGARAVHCPGPEDPQINIDCNDGKYGTLSNLVADHQERTPKIIRKSNPSNVETRYKIWGPSCDAWDDITSCTLPGVLGYGDWLLYEDMGAYTACCATDFNGMPKARVLYTSSEPGASALLGWI